VGSSKNWATPKTKLVQSSIFLFKSSLTYLPLGFQVLNELLEEMHYLLLLTIAHFFGHLLEIYENVIRDSNQSFLGC
jgi:hypothetical protein